jgi:hypothetical protein
MLNIARLPVALKVRLAREIALQRLKKRHEMVVLEAASEDDLRATHRRYFPPRTQNS